ncbi:MAG: orotate phosphoribosyltransferase, partial [Acidobacteriota bacterium]
MSPLASPPSGGDTPARRRTRLLALLSERALTLGDFTLASGRRSRYYLDARLVTLHAEGAYLVARAILDRLAHERVEADAIGGLTMGADPIAGAVAAVSHLVGKDLQAFIVRKTAKEHGTRRRIEGDLERGDRVVVVDDVVTTAGSTLRAIRAVEQVGCRVVAVVCLVDRQEGARERL